MAFSPGRNVGRVSIRVVPDTKMFRQQLKRQLEQVERTTTMTVRVDKANVDKVKVRESLRRQLAEFKNLDFDANVQVVVDKARLRRKKLRASIQAEFDRMGDVAVYIQPKIHKRDEEEFYKKVNHMVRKASRNTVNLNVDAQTLAASTQIRWVTRDRFVTVFVKVSKVSVVKALTALAALSGARLTWKWIDSLLDKFRNLDKNLPRIVNWTSAITALFAALAASTSGLVGIGQGLVSILPAFLVLPGLLLNAMGSATVLIVALRNAGDELSVLKDEMHELGDIINEQFWGRARKPIVDLVTGLMPQLRRAFRDLSAGVGDFTAAMAKAFGEELAGGRLESIFRGISDGWRVLGSGASGFAGALVNLSEIAAKYTPRLAHWFVRQANTFDAWLTAIATDRRLDRWMETAIDSMYDLWDVIRGVSGTFSGIWKAADAAGSGGLHGFAQLMLKWREVTHSADFQRGLVAVFRGSYVAMDAFGDALKAIGRLMSAMPVQFERFIGSAGSFIFRIIEGAAEALDNMNVRVGLSALSSGLDEAVEKIRPALDPIGQTFGQFLGLLGELARTILPAAVTAIGNLMPAVSAVIDAVEPVLEPLGNALVSISEELGPAIEDLVKTITPAFSQGITDLAAAIEEMGPALGELVRSVGPALAIALTAFVEILKPLLGFLNGFLGIVGPGIEGIMDLSWIVDDKKLDGLVQQIIDNGGWAADLFTWARDVDKQYAAAAQQHAGTYINTLSEEMGQSAPELVAGWTDKLKASFDSSGDVVANLLWSDFAGTPGMPPEVIEQVRQNLRALGYNLHDAAAFVGADIADAVGEGAASNVSNVTDPFLGLPTDIKDKLAPFANLFQGIGANMMGGIATGIRANTPAVVNAGLAAANKTLGALKRGLGIASPSKVTRMKIGRPIGQGIAKGIDDTRQTIARSAMNAVSPSMFKVSAGAGATSGRGGASINVTMPLLPGETPAEQRDNLVRELQWAL